MNLTAQALRIERASDVAPGRISLKRIIMRCKYSFATSASTIV
jgi:hypothetical protein